MSAESNDCDQINEWTLVNASGEDEVQSADAPPCNETPREGSQENISSTNKDAPIQLESKICEISVIETEKPVESLSVLDAELPETLPVCASKEGSEASDIERISDDGLNNYPMDASVISQISNFSILNASENRDVDMESIGSSSGISVIHDDENTDLSNFCSSKDELPDELDVKCVKTYTHTPNRRLNFALNLLLVLSVTMVVGLGVGHFIGWSSRWMHQRQLHQSHIAKLKALQEELVDCLQNPASYYLENNGESKACYEKVDYWKTKFEVILSENHVLQDFVDRTMHKDDADDDDDEKCEEANKHIVTEYRQLKFHLINQQLENVATLRQVEALKRQEMETLHRVRLLEEENEELKAQVEEESNAESSNDDDDDEDKQIIRLLANENQELRQELNGLMTALKLEQEEDEKKTTEQLWPLRQQINQLKVENSELQQVIAKLRYGQPPAESQEQEKKAPPKSKFARREASKPDNALHSWLVENMNELNLTGFIEYLTKVAMDKEAARQELMQLQESLKVSYEQLSEKAKHGIDTGKTLLSDLQNNLHSKLQQIMNVDPSETALPIEQIRMVGKTLRKTVEKMYAIGMDMLNTKTEDGPQKDDNHKFQMQVDKLILKFGKQWENIKSSVWGGRAPENDRSENNNMDIRNVDIDNAKSFKHKRDKGKDEGEGEHYNAGKAEQESKKRKEDGNKREKAKQKKTTMNNGMDKWKQNGNNDRPADDEPSEINRKNEKNDKKKEKFRHGYDDKPSRADKKKEKNVRIENNPEKTFDEPVKSAEKKEKIKKKNKDERKLKKQVSDKDELAKTSKKKEKKFRKDAVDDDLIKNYAEKSMKIDGKSEKSKKKKDKDEEKFRKSYNKRVDDDGEEQSKAGKKKEKKFKKDAVDDIPAETTAEKSLKIDGKNEKSEKKKDKDEEKFRKSFNKRVEDDKKRSKPGKEKEKKSKNEAMEDDQRKTFDKHNKKATENNPKKQKFKNERRYEESKNSKSKEDDDDTPWKYKGHINSKRILNSNNTQISDDDDDSSGEWMFKRAEGRTTKRKSTHQSDWLFERAYDREHSRKEAHRSDWYFNKNKKNYENYEFLSSYPRKHSGDSAEEGNGGKQAKSKKKAYKMRKNQKSWSSDEDSDNEESWSERKHREYAYQYEYRNFHWAVPDQKAYYSS